MTSKNRTAIKYIAAAAGICLLLAAVFFYYFRPASGPVVSGIAEIHFIDVGQGDCSLIITADSTVLIDCGEEDEYTTVSRYLERLGISSLGYIVISHPHSDHMGGMYRIAENFGAGAVIMPDTGDSAPDISPYRKLLAAAEDRSIPVMYAKAGSSFTLGSDCRMEIIAPVGEYDNLNDFSAVVRLVCGETAFLFAGDIERDAEQDILDSGRDISADVIKVPHHGSGSSGLKTFLQAVSPEYAVFTAGEGNDFGHPHANIVDLYRKLGAQIFRTDLNGNITFYTDGRHISVKTDK